MKLQNVPAVLPSVLTAATLTFAANVTSPTITQATTDTLAFANTMTIRAQSTNVVGGLGGTLELKGGIGPAGNGGVYLEGSSVRLADDSGTLFKAMRASGIVAYVSPLAFDENVASPIIRLNARTDDAACSNLTITGQAPFAGATGANRNAGGIVLQVPSPVAGGTGAYVQIINSGGNVALFGSGSIIWYAPNVYWTQGAANPKLYQQDVATASITGASLTVQAQNATGLTSTGGGLNLSSGTGTTTAGNVALQTGGTTRFYVSPTQVVSYLSIFTSAQLYFTANDAAPSLAQVTHVSDLATNNITIAPQIPWVNATGANRVPGSLFCAIAAPTNGGTTHGEFKVTVAGGDALRISKDGAGAVTHGFFGGAPVVKGVVNGSRANPEAALRTLLSVLAGYSMITDTTTP